MTASPDPDRVATERTALRQRLLPGGVPTLWCPLLTPYDDAGRIDAARLARHLDHLQPAVRGFLVPGSTGDGWELSDAEVRTLLEAVVPLAVERGLALLVGVLKPDAAAMQAALHDTLAWLAARAGTDDRLEALRRNAVAGFTFCAPHGAGLSQEAIGGALDALLATGVPAALYQLPQVTGNEIAPDTLRALAARHPNLLMLKDTSGADRIAESGPQGLEGVFLVRGAEGGYARHLKPAGGRYDGFLLSTANVFGAELARVAAYVDEGRRTEAEALAARLEGVVDTVFAAAAAVPVGNPFTNANKALDHVMAHGPEARRVPPPRLHAGARLPAALVETAIDALSRHALLPARGYLTN